MIKNTYNFSSCSNIFSKSVCNVYKTFTNEYSHYSYSPIQYTKNVSDLLKNAYIFHAISERVKLVRKFTKKL